MVARNVFENECNRTRIQTDALKETLDRVYEERTISLSTAVQVTESFASIEPADPVKYDFALSRIGILDNCNGRCRTECRACELYKMCFERENWAQ